MMTPDMTLPAFVPYLVFVLITAIGFTILLWPLVRQHLAWAALGLLTIFGLGGAFWLQTGKLLPDYPYEKIHQQKQVLLWQRVEVLQAALTQDPNHLEHWRELGALYGRLKQWEAARYAFLAAQSLDLETPYEGLLLELEVKQQNGIISEDLARVLKGHLSRNPNDLAILYYYGLYLTQKGDFAGALPYWQKVSDSAKKTEPWYRQFKENYQRLQQEIVK